MLPTRDSGCKGKKINLNTENYTSKIVVCNVFFLSLLATMTINP